MSVPQAIRDALRAVAGRVTGSARRNIQAWVAKTYCHGSPRHAETVFGWNRRAVAGGIRGLKQALFPVQRKRLVADQQLS